MAQTLSSISAWQGRSEMIIEDATKWIRASLSTNVHSLYLFGSFATGRAKPHLSNLDLLVVLHREQSGQLNTIKRNIEWRFSQSFPEITGINIRTVTLSEVLSLDNIFKWGFLLKQCCVCLHGDDLTHCFGQFEPNWEISKFWNMNLEETLPSLRKHYVQVTDQKAQFLQQREIGKKLLRAHYGLVLHKHRVWLDDPLQCADVAQHYYPSKQVEIKRLTLLLRPHLIPKRSVVGLLDSHGDWLVKSYKKTEFRIG